MNNLNLTSPDLCPFTTQLIIYLWNKIKEIFND